MPDKNRLLDPHGVKNGDVVSGPGRDVVAVARLARGQEPAAGDPDHAEIVGELKGELVVDVGVVSEPGEQHHRRA